MNKLNVFWFKNRQDIRIGLFCLLLIFFACYNLHKNLGSPGKNGLIWAGWMALVIGASMVLGVAVNKIAVREQKPNSGKNAVKLNNNSKGD